MGDMVGFDALYQRHAPQVAMVCRARLRDEADVADAVQETFARAFRQLDTFRGGPLFGHWLSRIARRVAIDYTRKVRTRAEVPLEEAVCIGTAADALGTAVQQLAVRSMLTSLSARDARLLVSHHVEGHSVRELATQWGLTEGAMAVALQRARVRARAAAVRESLPVIAGLAAWRLIVGLRSRGRPISLAATAMPVLVAVVVLLPILGPVVNGPAMGELESHDSRPAQGLRRADAYRVPAATHLGSSNRIASHQRREVPAAARSDVGPAEPDDAHDQPAFVPFDPVDVPGTGRRLHNERPRGKADYEIGVRLEHGDNSAEVKVEVFDEPTAEEAHATACTAADYAPAVAYCERGN